MSFPSPYIGMMAVLLMAAVGCSEKEIAVETGAVARVHDRYLYAAELEGLVPAGSTSEDSAAIVEAYIENWTKQEVFYHHAEENIPEDLLDVERLVEDYRRTLLIYSYENALVSQQLDTFVSKSDMIDHYKKHPDHFLLDDHVLKTVYLKFDTAAEDLYKVSRWMKLKNEDDLTELQAFAGTRAMVQYYDSTSWRYYGDLMQVLPLPNKNEDSFLSKEKSTRFRDNGTISYIFIQEYKLKGDLAPLEMVTTAIRNEIINSRKQELISKMRRTLYESALDRQNVERYEIP